eukprot:249575_1
MAQPIVKSIDKLINEISELETTNQNVKTIGTHHGTFHCDEVLACYMLRNHTKEFRNAKIIRSRDPNILSTADIIVDVGAEFDISCNKFDHHQNSFNECFSDAFETKLSSAGLIYKYYGKQIIADIIGSAVDDDVIDLLHKKVYEALIEGIDAIDNGIKQYDTDKQQRFKLNTDLSARVRGFNPWWNQETSDEIVMNRFNQAMQCVGSALVDRVLWMYQGWLPAREIVQNAIQNRFDVDKSGKILTLSRFCPWSEHFYQIHEEETPMDPMPLYVLFEDTKGQWRIRATPVYHGSFDNIKPLPKEWCGKRGKELDAVCGVKDCVFVHSAGSIGG